MRGELQSKALATPDQILRVERPLPAPCATAARPHVDRNEPNRSARLAAADDRNVGGDHRRDLGIAAGRLVVDHEDDRLARAGHLDRAHDGTVGDDVIAFGMCQRGSIETVAHPIGVIGNDIVRRQQRRDGVVGEIIPLWSQHHADRLLECDVEGPRQRMLVANVHAGECKRQAVALPQRAPVKAANAAANIGGRAAQQRRDTRSSLDREIGADRIAKASHPKHFVAHEAHAPAGGNDAHHRSRSRYPRCRR